MISYWVFVDDDGFIPDADTELPIIFFTKKLGLKDLEEIKKDFPDFTGRIAKLSFVEEESKNESKK